MNDRDAGTVHDGLAKIWAKSADLTLSRVVALEEAATSLLDGPLSPEGRDTARRAAHALAGSAGTFGFSNASSISKEAETLLEGDAPIPQGGVLRLATIAVDLRRQLVGAAPPAPIATDVPAAGVPRVETVANIVAVDDDTITLHMLEASLRVHGIEVHGVSSPSKAVEEIAARRPDLVMLDVDMPGLDGFAVCKQIRANPATASVPVLFLTTHTEERVISALYEAGADDYMTKPAKPADLAARITNRLSRVRRVRDGGGSTGTVPIAAPPSRTLPGIPSAPLTTDVAIVDDDAVLTALLTHTLDARGYRSVVIDEGTAAVAQLCGTSPTVRPAVILLDVSLPGLDGFAVLRALARDGVTRRARVIMLTARSLESEVLQALQLGAHDHIAKPFSVPVLMQRLRVAFDGIADPQ